MCVGRKLTWRAMPCASLVSRKQLLQSPKISLTKIRKQHVLHVILLRTTPQNQYQVCCKSKTTEFLNWYIFRETHRCIFHIIALADVNKCSWYIFYSVFCRRVKPWPNPFKQIYRADTWKLVCSTKVLSLGHAMNIRAIATTSWTPVWGRKTV